MKPQTLILVALGIITGLAQPAWARRLRQDDATPPPAPSWAVENEDPLEKVPPRPEPKAYRVQVQEEAAVVATPLVAPESTRPEPEAKDPHERGLFMGGPRVGMTYLSGDGYEKLRKSVRESKPGSDVDAYMTHFGWQLEYRIFKTDKGLTALTEVIPVVMAMDQGLALPSVNWLIGVRGRNGFEMGVGPNLGLNGVSMVAGTGFTFDLGGINVPLNLAVGLGSKTTSTSLSIGFNL